MSTNPPPVLGATYTDRITGFQGVAIGFVQYITGCNQVLVAPKVGADGAMKDSQWIDEQRLVVDHTLPFVEIINGTAASPMAGFDRAPPKR
jgi:hypothetical protein